MGDAGVQLASTVTSVAALGFVPVAIHFRLFSLLNERGPVATAEQLTAASDAERSPAERQDSPLCVRLTEDTMLAMAGLGLVDLVDDTTFRANALTAHMDAVPSCLDGMLHFTTEPLWAAAFFMRQLRETHFEYPFRECETPTQFGYRLIGEESFARAHTYSIMHQQGRMPSFNRFMEGKFGRFGSMPERMTRFGYDLAAALEGSGEEVAVVDIGGGRGEMLLEVQQAFPHLTKHQLVLQEFAPDPIHRDAVTVSHWDFKDDSPQPIQGARVYSLTHIYHNLPDLDALRLMTKLAAAMSPSSRMLIHEFSKNAVYGKVHATMIQLYAGRTRCSREWRQMAALAGLDVTFEAYPDVGEGLVEMRIRQRP